MGIRDATDFANWSKNKDGWDTLEEHCDPSRCAGVTMESGKITKIELPSSNLSGGEFSLAHIPRYRTTTCVPDFDLSLVLGPIPESLSQLRSLQILALRGNKLSGAVNMFGTSPVMSQVTLRLFF